MTSESSAAPSYDQVNASVLPPEYGPSFGTAYTQWITARDASHEFDVLELKCQDLQKQLDSASEELRALKEKSAACFAALHTERSLVSRLFGFGKKKDHKEAGENEQTEAERREAAKAEFERAHAEETRQAGKFESLQLEKESLVKKMEAQRPIAASCDQAWAALVAVSQSRMPDSTGAADAAFEDVTRAQMEYDSAKQMLVDFTRARVTVQHAHKYFTMVLKVCDDLNPGKKGSTAVEGLGGEWISMTKEVDYRNAITQANKAQVCLDECHRVLGLYDYAIPEERQEDSKALKELGLMQVSKVYDLMYRGSPTGGSVRKSVRMMIERQEKAFVHLTALAVWIQEYTLSCETTEKLAKARRDDTRNRVAAPWIEGNA